MPATIVSPRATTAASVPIRLARRGASGEPTDIQTTGSVVSTPAPAADSGTSSRSSSSSGGTLATAVRRFSAVNTIAPAISASCRGCALAGTRSRRMPFGGAG
jgi:hypothetical protein